MANRNLLHRSKLSEFVVWLNENGHDYVEKPAEYQVISWNAVSGPKPIIFDGKSSEHYSCNEASVPFVMNFLNKYKEVAESFDSAFELLTNDLGEVQLLIMRSNMMNAINALIKSEDWTQKEAAEHLGVSQPRISNLKNGRISKFSAGMLMGMLSKLGFKFEFNYEPKDIAMSMSVTKSNLE